MDEYMSKFVVKRDSRGVRAVVDVANVSQFQDAPKGLAHGVWSKSVAISFLKRRVHTQRPVHESWKQDFHWSDGDRKDGGVDTKNALAQLLVRDTLRSATNGPQEPTPLQSAEDSTRSGHCNSTNVYDTEMMLVEQEHPVLHLDDRAGQVVRRGVPRARPADAAGCTSERGDGGGVQVVASTAHRRTRKLTAVPMQSFSSQELN
ncbi:hypothetical protein EV122DRAFT_254842 [Schizophyllum commune]